MLITFETFAVWTVIFEQIEGVRFPSLPRVFVPQVGTASGAQALINQRPGEDFPGPLDMEFSAPQFEVSLVAGVDVSSSAPVNAVLRASDAEGNEVAADGPFPIGPGPTSIRTFMQVASPSALIVRVQLAYEGGFAVVIDNLDFDVVGPAPPPDTEAPVVVIRQPEEGAVVTGAMFFLEGPISSEAEKPSATF